MNARPWELLRSLGSLGLIGAYFYLSHLSDSQPNASGLALVVGLGPLAFFGLLLAWRQTHRVLALALWAGAIGVAWNYAALLGAHLDLIDLAQDLAAYGALAFTFGRSLAPRRTPLCTEWAITVHGELSEEALRYTRRVTVAWALLFALITLTLIALYRYAPLATWLSFANFGALGLIAAMFAGEYAVRTRVLPQLATGGMLEGLRAYVRSTQLKAAREAAAPPPPRG